MSVSESLALVWFRHDLRLSDNPALAYALRHHRRVLCAYIDEQAEKTDPSASDWWRYRALADLGDQLHGRLLYRAGSAQVVLQSLIAEYQLDAVYWNREYDPEAVRRDKHLKAWLKAQGLSVASFPGNVLFEPWEVKKSDDTPYRVFTPFYKAAVARGPALPVDTPPVADHLADVRLQLDCPTLSAIREDWAGQIGAHWQPTRAGAQALVDDFKQRSIARYKEQRDYPSVQACSRLSPYLHFGQMGVRELVAQVQQLEGADAYVRELIWREFAHTVLFHWPDTLQQPLDARFAQMPWRDDASELQAWQQGNTGVPMVDAGMRELWHTGFMHNRVRMVVASFLTKHQLMDWRSGQAWFDYTLVDADLANNTMGWQWTAGCGVDAAPYFRVFNPVTQGERFDAQGDYVRRWVPELKYLPNKWLHQPWQAPSSVLAEAGVQLGKDYPRPVVELVEGRQRALAVWDKIKG